MTLDQSTNDERILLIGNESNLDGINDFGGYHDDDDDDDDDDQDEEDEEDEEDDQANIKVNGCDDMSFAKYRAGFWSRIFSRLARDHHNHNNQNPNWIFQHAAQDASFYNTIASASSSTNSTLAYADHAELDSSDNRLAGSKLSNQVFDHRFAQSNGRQRKLQLSAGMMSRSKCFRCRPTLVTLLLILVTICTFMFSIKLFALISQQRSLIRQASRFEDSIENELEFPIDPNKFQLSSGLDSTNWLVSSSKCHIPRFDEWHKSIEEFTWRREPLNCSKISAENGYTSKPLTFISNNRLSFTQAAIDANAMNGCCYRELVRSNENDDDLEAGEKCNNFTITTLNSPAPLIRVECPLLNYTNVHSFVVHDIEEESALRKVAASKLEADEYYNVVMVGVDTISRLNAYRQLNKTLSYLKTAYGALEFAGYNKVGENTFPNLVPLLTGLRPEQLIETMCWLATNYTQENERGDDYLDNCKYLWNFYQQVGYLTYFSEDWAKASTFNYLKSGFKNQPTNFYGRPFVVARESLLYPPVGMGCQSCLLDRPIVDVDLNNLKTFIEENHRQPFFAFQWINCPQHDDLNGASQVDSIIEKFFTDIYDLIENNRTFVFFFSDHGYRWNNFVSTRIGHYESSLPLLTIAPPKHFIEHHPELYENLKQHQSSLLTPFDMFKTLIHIRNLGMKASKESKHKQTKRSSIPTTTTIKPSMAPDSYSQQSDSVSTPTASTTVSQLKQVDGLSYHQEFESFSILKHHNQTKLDRSCIEAGIPDNYCVCNQFEPIAADSIDVEGATYFLVYIHMYNHIKKNLDICRPLDLESIHKAEIFDFSKTQPTTEKPKRKQRQTIKTLATSSTTPAPIESVRVSGPSEQSHLPNREYNILLSTKPGSALFQEVVRYYGHDMNDCKAQIEEAKSVITNSTTTFDDKYSAVLSMNSICQFSVHSESISRLNLYKDQSKCVKSGIELKKMCYCNDLPIPATPIK